MLDHRRCDAAIGRIAHLLMLSLFITPEAPACYHGYQVACSSNPFNQMFAWRVSDVSVVCQFVFMAVRR